MKVEFSMSAQRDLVAILEYLRPLNPRAAKRIVDELEKRCRSLSRFPRRGAPALTRGGTVVRRLVVGQHLILYEVTDQLVVIDAVVHGARDYEQLLKLRAAAAKED